MRLGITRFDYVWIVDAVYRWVAMPDDFFHQQTAKMESLAHRWLLLMKKRLTEYRDKSNTTVGYNDIFKDQFTKLESRPNKPSKKQATGKIEKKKSKEKVRCFTGMGNRIFVVITIIILLFILTTLGGIIFVVSSLIFWRQWTTGNRNRKSIRLSTIRWLFQRNKGKQKYNPNDGIRFGPKVHHTVWKLCQLYLEYFRKQKLSSLPFAWLFSWSLYATVGYGHRVSLQ